MTLDAVIFDFDGVLVDSVQIKEKAFGVLYAEYGSKVKIEVMAHHRCNGGMSRFDKFRYYHEFFLRKKLSDEEVEKLNQKFSRLVTELVINAKEVPSASSVLFDLSQQVPLHVVSGTPEVELNNIINARKMDGYFRSIHGSPTKKTEHITKILTHYNYQKQKIWMLGDSLIDYTSAHDAGINFIGFMSSADGNPFPSQVQVISNLNEFYSAIRSN